MPSAFFIFQSLHKIGQSVAAGIQIGMIDLFGITGENNFCAFSDARKQRFDHMRREILRFIANDELAGNAPSPDVGERLHFQQSPLPQMIDYRVLFVFIAEQKFNIIINGLHPGTQFLFTRTGKITQIVADRHDGARHQKAAIAFLFYDFFQTDGQRQKRFSRARTADDGCHLDVVVQQQFQGEALFLVLGADAEIDAIAVDKRIKPTAKMPCEGRL